MSLKSGSKLQLNSKYEIVKEVGDGGFGAVFEAITAKTKKKVAIKLFKGEAFQNTAECKMYWERERDLTEATTGWPEGPHMKYIEAKEDKSDRSRPKFYLVFSFIENGQTLKSWFNDNLRAPEKERMGVDDMVEHIFLPLCKYMAYSHNKGAIHRDFTFNNIMIVKDPGSNQPHPIVIDWGGGKTFDPSSIHDEPPSIDDMEGSGTVIITPGFFAPEIIMQKPPIPQTDIYMFGAVLFYSLTNGYTRVKPTVSSDYILHPQDYNMNVSDTLNDIVEKCTQYEPKDRFRTFDEIKQALEQHLAGNVSGLDQLPTVGSENAFILRMINNNSLIQLNPNEMALEEGKNIRVGREKIIESAAWDEAYKGVFRGVTRCTVNGKERPREQFFLGYSKNENVFYIHEGRNSNPTYLEGNRLPPDQWIPIVVGQNISVHSTTVRGVFELISVLDI